MSDTIDEDLAVSRSGKEFPMNGSSRVALVGDIGGTHARFALASIGADGGPALLCPRIYLYRDFASPEDAARAYLADSVDAVQERPGSAALAVAGPPMDGRITFTNIDWTITETDFSQALGLGSTTLLNDFAALAMAAPLLGEKDLKTVGPDVQGRADASIALLGAGTGLGVSCLVRDGSTESILATEGGHISIAPVDEFEVEIWRWLMGKFGRVSVERVLSGPGLLNLYNAMCEIMGAPAICDTPAAVTLAAHRGDAIAKAARHQFCAFMGSFAGDIALMFGAMGGVYLGGGLTQHFMDVLDDGLFRTRFEAKGRLESFVKAIPTRVVIHPHTAALLGSARALQRRGLLV